MTNARLRELIEMGEKATKGPWSHLETGSGKDGGVIHTNPDGYLIAAYRNETPGICEELLRCREMLKELQWSPSLVEIFPDQCPICAEFRTHAPGCRLAALLKETK